MTQSPDHLIPQVWVDTDVALGAPSGDVDDGFALAALLAAHRLGRVELLGISTVFGNTSPRRAESCARELCLRTGVALPVLPGTAKAGKPSAASEAIAALPDGAKILCLGPLSNVAAACRAVPALSRRVELLAVGGCLASRGFLPPLWPFDFNFARDRRGAREVLAVDWPRLTLYPLDVLARLRADAQTLWELGRQSALGGYLEDQSGRWLRRARWRYAGRSFPLWDLVPALDLLDGLAGRHEVRTLSRGSRWLLGGLAPVRCLVSFDAERAWSSFRSMLRA